MRAAFFALAVTMCACAKKPAPTECPKDLLAARGSPCGAEGKTCGAENAGAEPTHLLMCSRGTWIELEVPPGPR